MIYNWKLMSLTYGWAIVVSLTINLER